jgi:nitric oxide reductase large subunit
MRRMLGLAIALAAVATIILWGAWLVLLRASEPARARLAGSAARQQLGPGQLLLLGLVAIVAIVLLALTKRS